MKFRSLIPAIALLISATELLANSATPSTSWRSCGSNIVMTSADNAAVLSAIRTTHKKLRAFPARNASGVDPSFQQHCTYGQAAEGGVIRATTQFKDKSGAAVEIECIHRTGEETMVFFGSGGETDVEAVRKEFIGALERQGVKNIE